MVLINGMIESNSARKMADLEDPTIWDDGDVSCVRDFINLEFKSAALFVIFSVRLVSVRMCFV